MSQSRSLLSATAHVRRIHLNRHHASQSISTFSSTSLGTPRSIRCSPPPFDPCSRPWLRFRLLWSIIRSSSRTLQLSFGFDSSPSSSSCSHPLLRDEVVSAHDFDHHGRTTSVMMCRYERSIEFLNVDHVSRVEPIIECGFDESRYAGQEIEVRHCYLCCLFILKFQ